MSIIRRSPPGSKVHQVSSESDISNIEPENPLNYVGRRQKKTRNEDQRKGIDDSLKDELLSMLTNWKKDQDLILSKLCSDIAELKQQNANIQSTNIEMEKALTFISTKYEGMNTKIINLERERKENYNYILSLENRLEDVQKRLKSTVIEFRNLPTPAQNIKQETQQDLCDLVQKICDVLNVNFHPSEIKDIFRIKTKAGVSTVITELTSVLSKNKILSGAKEFNKININNKLSSKSIGLSSSTMPNIYI
ncbi:unnamed protein product [Parnassius apollo]|uniref:(apollo) hypothetical protein n=1 Tax=Parnassius apollo TaxID=110799 RepID=A0A8S3YAJ4_PARAO|nr:unnamed protein product [Parnassius apollo]